ncbi:MAG: ribonuclease H-like domain-containing protein [Candidatus Aureabacteria bacterium]|nr:ribonuclease H-like domain-containing protein [Candidatus Auribacterota bacterium]
MFSAYLDIETTSVAPEEGDLTVIGVYRERDGEGTFIQLVGEDISVDKLIPVFMDSPTLYTYNGERFDLPYIKAKLGVNLNDYCTHHDLMHSCHRQGLYGGMKKVERLLGIARKLTDIDGRAAVQLWRNYTCCGCAKSLATLLEYNREDVMNLKVMREALKRTT